MSKVRIRLKFLRFWAALVLALSTTSSLGLRAQAQSVTFNPPSGNGGSPGTTDGGAARGKCPQDVSVKTTSLTALIPDNHPALTVAAHPTFLVYVPQTTASSAELTVVEGTDNGIYQTRVALTGHPGVVSISLPDSEPALEIGKHYQWKFAVICNPEDRLNDDLVVSGWIQRIDPKLPSLEGLNPLERTSVYASKGIWYEAVNTLAQLRRENPQDLTITSKWEELLKSTGLGNIASEPINK